MAEPGRAAAHRGNSGQTMHGATGSKPDGAKALPAAERMPEPMGNTGD